MKEYFRILTRNPKTGMNTITQLIMKIQKLSEDIGWTFKASKIIEKTAGNGHYTNFYLNIDRYNRIIKISNYIEKGHVTGTGLIADIFYTEGHVMFDPQLLYLFFRAYCLNPSLSMSLFATQRWQNVQAIDFTRYYGSPSLLSNGDIVRALNSLVRESGNFMKHMKSFSEDDSYSLISFAKTTNCFSGVTPPLLALIKDVLFKELFGCLPLDLIRECKTKKESISGRFQRFFAIQINDVLIDEKEFLQAVDLRSTLQVSQNIRSLEYGTLELPQNFNQFAPLSAPTKTSSLSIINQHQDPNVLGELNELILSVNNDHTANINFEKRNIYINENFLIT